MKQMQSKNAPDTAKDDLREAGSRPIPPSINRIALVFGISFAALGIALGAFGAHGLRSLISLESLQIFETGVRYQMYHAFALIICGILGHNRYGNPSTLRISILLFIIGIVLFSGSLYVLAVSDTRWVGFITPLGGIAFLAGWVSLLLAVIRADRSR